MKLITLNIWGAKHYSKVMDFVKSHSKTTDIFCFQEVYKSERKQKTPNECWSDVLGDFNQLLPEFDFRFSPTFHGRDYDYEVDYPLSQGSAVFWKKGLSLKEKGETFIHYRENERHFFSNGKMDPPRLFQYLIFDDFLVVNLHGYWEPAPKHDNEIRFAQSQAIIDFSKKHNVPKIIAGDFNLRIDTKSLLMFEENGYRNLVKESKAPTTRSTLYDIKWRRIDKFADYILVSKDLAVYDFKVMKDEVSDHLPLSLEFEP